jgi:hypothetical protein
LTEGDETQIRAGIQRVTDIGLLSMQPDAEMAPETTPGM